MFVKKYQLKITLQILIFLIFVSASHFYNLNPTYAQNILFQDSFEDGNADGWTEYSPQGKWYFEDGEYVGTVVNNHPLQQSYSIAGDQTWTNYSFSVTVKGTEGVDKVILFRINEERNAYKLNLRSGFLASEGNDLKLAKRLPIGTGNHKLLKSVSYENHPHIPYELRVDLKNEANGVSIKVFINNSLILEYLDQDDPIQNGAIGLEVWPGIYSSGENLRTTTHYDDVLVTTLPGSSPTPSPSPILDVPDIKQYDPLWKDKEYDRASEWAPGMDTIERWGCGLTSATMVLQYHGFPVNPDELNDWLNGESDGYIRNGLLNWLAVSRYTYQNIIEDSPPTLEFRRYDASPIALEKELNAKRPPILGLSGHFVVAKGKQDLDFLINDPDSTNTLLSFVEANREADFSAIYSYLPSSTNLSYIMLVVDSDITLEVYNSDDQSVGNFYPDEFLEDDFGNNESEHLNIFLLPEPKDDIYRIEATGTSGAYQLVSYLYNEEGEVKINSFGGLIDEGQTDEFLITINDTSEMEPHISIDAIIEDLENANSQGLINNPRIYRLLRTQLSVVKKLQDREFIRPVKNLLIHIYID